MDGSFLPPLMPGELRPAAALQSNLLAVLQEGRILSGEVLQRLDGGTVLIGVGEHRIPARAQVELEPGARLRIQVEKGEQGHTLRIVDADRPPPAKIVQLLRAVVGDLEPLAQGLSRLSAALESAPEKSPPAAQQLLARLREERRVPVRDGTTLRGRLANAGFAQEARLARVAVEQAPTRERAAWLEPARSALAEVVARSFPGGERAFAEALREELARWLPETERPPGAPTRQSAGFREVTPRDLETLLLRAFARKGDGSGSESSRAAAQRTFTRVVRSFHLSALGSELRGQLLQALLGERVVERPGAPPLRELAAAAEGDLKAALLKAFEQLDEPALRDAVRRTLGGIEAEQLLNLVRAESGEPQHWMLALPDGERWTTLHVHWQDERRRARDGAPSGRRRLVLGVEFRDLGPVRMDLSLHEPVRGGADAEPSNRRLDVHVTVVHPELAERLRTDAERLAVAMASGDVRVALHVHTAEPDQLDLAEGLSDFARHAGDGWMDVRG